MQGFGGVGVGVVAQPCGGLILKFVIGLLCCVLHVIGRPQNVVVALDARIGAHACVIDRTEVWAPLFVWLHLLVQLCHVGGLRVARERQVVLVVVGAVKVRHEHELFAGVNGQIGRSSLCDALRLGRHPGAFRLVKLFDDLGHGLPRSAASRAALALGRPPRTLGGSLSG